MSAKDLEFKPLKWDTKRAIEDALKFGAEQGLILCKELGRNVSYLALPRALGGGQMAWTTIGDTQFISVNERRLRDALHTKGYSIEGVAATLEHELMHALGATHGEVMRKADDHIHELVGASAKQNVDMGQPRQTHVGHIVVDHDARDKSEYAILQAAARRRALREKGVEVTEDGIPAVYLERE